jgi:nitrogen fixation NifU-like protein
VTDGIDELYQEMILEHYKHPRNYGELANATQSAEGFNPVCGDRYRVFLKMEGGVIEDVRFVGSGCAISKASASMMTAAVKGKKKEEAETLFREFQQMLTGKANGDVDRLGKLKVFAGVSEFPIRVKCANLAWHTLRAGLRGSKEAVTTE